jgi:RNA polymerase sigma-70 factor (ECF subfamily)
MENPVVQRAVQRRLVSTWLFPHPPTMQLPDLQALQRGDAAAWDMAFPWLWPAAFGAAQVTLQPYFPAEVEDVAIESLEALVEKVRELKSVEELKPLVASIAHHRAVSLLRERFAKKRGEGRTGSPDTVQEAAGVDCPDPMADSPLAALEQKELAERLSQTLSELKPPQVAILTDFFLNGLSYEEIAQKHGIPKNSVGVYLKRGRETLRRIWGRRGES